MKKAIFLLILILAIYALIQIGDSAAFSAGQDPWRFRTGLRNSNGNKRLNEPQLRQLINSLRRKTGFLEMRFDESGFLSLGDRTRFIGGSASARDLLVACVDGNSAVELEDHNNSPEVAFARITGGTIYHDFQTKTQIKVRQVQLDFSDFGELRGERDVKESFDLGFAVLHELVHGILGLRDAANGSIELGDCDERINRMRRDLNLPERQGYNAGIQVVMASSAGTLKQVELVFARDRRQEGQKGKEWFYLRWDAKKVASDATSNGAILAQNR